MALWAWLPSTVRQSWPSFYHDARIVILATGQFARLLFADASSVPVCPVPLNLPTECLMRVVARFADGECHGQWSKSEASTEVKEVRAVCLLVEALSSWRSALEL